MFKTRVMTAVVLLVLLVAVLLRGGQLGWSVFVLAALLGAFWEWARLGQFGKSPALVYAILCTSLCAVAAFNLDMALLNFPLLALAGVFWVAFVPWCLSRVSVGALANRAVFATVGFVVIAAAGIALLLAKAEGTVFLLSTLAICFAADIFAYVFGKTLGKNKLAPSISPGKSWEGAIGGALSVLALSWLVVSLAAHYPELGSTWQARAHAQWHPALFSMWLVVLSAYSVVGDLFESMLKRRAGLKDSSNLLPGHGGVLDRIDAQLPVLPLAVLLVSASLA